MDQVLIDRLLKIGHPVANRLHTALNIHPEFSEMSDHALALGLIVLSAAMGKLTKLDYEAFMELAAASYNQIEPEKKNESGT